jgi:hypothetical protein
LINVLIVYRPRPRRPTDRRDPPTARPTPGCSWPLATGHRDIGFREVTVTLAEVNQISLHI